MGEVYVGQELVIPSLKASGSDKNNIGGLFPDWRFEEVTSNERRHLEAAYVPFSKSAAELLFELVSRAYERQSLIVTTNLMFESWIEVLGGERLTGALLDRLTHRVHILEANGPSYRLRESKRRLKRKPSVPEPPAKNDDRQTEPQE